MRSLLGAAFPAGLVNPTQRDGRALTLSLLLVYGRLLVEAYARTLAQSLLRSAPLPWRARVDPGAPSMRRADSLERMPMEQLQALARQLPGRLPRARP